MTCCYLHGKSNWELSCIMGTQKKKKDWEGWGWAVCPEGLGEVVFGDVNNVLLGPCIANSYTLFLLVSLAVSGWFGRYFVFWSLV